ncbi:MAG TPA: phosphatase PAP2 family protein [Gaiellaceae bacterium]|nr:phosphatase PAP2 family protein [Gaiellaceae bacterium]
MVGYAGFVWIALAIAVAVVTGRSVLGVGALTAFSVWAADLVALVVKVAVGRDRPFEDIPEPEPLMTATAGTSMPSGHAATSAAGAVVLSALAPRAAPAFVLLALAVGYSRVYVGVHYPADVLVGFAIGAVAGRLGLLLRGPLRLEESPTERSRSQREG